MSNDQSCRSSFLKNHKSIQTLGFLGYIANQHGELSLLGDPEMIRLAQSQSVAVLPLVFNGKFDQDVARELLSNEVAQTRLIQEMLNLAKQHQFIGWQMDFENVNVRDKEKLTQFYSKVSVELRKNNLGLSIAVVPRNSEIAETSPYAKWLFENWSGVYDYASYTKFADFISLMTYDQHTKRTPPGPIAGVGWVYSCLKHLEGLGVNMQKVSLGIPVYSHRWYSSFDKVRLGYATGKQIQYSEAMRLLEVFNGRLNWDREDATSWAEFRVENWNEVLAVEDVRSFQEKLKLVSRFNLRGISVFRLGWEDPRIWTSIPSR